MVFGCPDATVVGDLVFGGLDGIFVGGLVFSGPVVGGLVFGGPDATVVGDLSVVAWYLIAGNLKWGEAFVGDELGGTCS